MPRFAAILFVMLGFVLNAGQVKEKAAKAAPPGTIWLKDNIFIDQSPVLNIDYLEYEWYMRHKINFNLHCLEEQVEAAVAGSTTAGKLLTTGCAPNPDSIYYKIDRSLPVSWADAITANYLKKPGMPCVNITYLTASTYCEWRTLVVKLSNARETNRRKRQKQYRNIRYRLPLREEWEYALEKFAGKLVKPVITPDSSYYLATDLKRKAKNYTLQNISEMVLERGIAKGPNWQDEISFTNPNYTTAYRAPADWLGFRCVCEVEE